MKKTILTILSCVAAWVFCFAPLQAQTVAWLEGMIGTNDIEDRSFITAIGSDDQENGIFAGSFLGTLVIDNDTFRAQGSSQDVFFAKIDVNGTLVWTSQVEARGAFEVRDIAVEPAGDFYVTGYVTDTMFLGLDTFPQALNSQGSDIFTAKFSKDGDYQWAKRVQGFRNNSANAITLGGGNVYVGGRFTNLTYLSKIVCICTSCTFCLVNMLCIRVLE